MKKILFLCTGNSCRSQMAEGLCRYLHSSIFDCQSAGIEAHGLNPNAVKVMGEIGIDISSQESKTLNQLPDLFFDYVITVCGHADENCPIFPYGAKKIHIGFDDPAKLTIGLGYEEMLQVFRRIRDEIGDRIKHLPDLLNGD